MLLNDRITLHFKCQGVAFAAGILVLVLTQYLIQLQNQSYKADEQLKSAIYGNLLWTEVDRELNSLLFISNGMASYINVYKDELEPEKIKAILKNLWQQSKHVRNLGVAVGYQLTYVYPEASNQNIIGKDYREIPQQWPKVKQAIDSRQGVLDGPIQLIQGGSGMIYRYPIFIDGKYWGMLSTVIDTDDFLQAAFKNTPSDMHEFGIRTADNKKVFYGDAKLFLGQDTFRQTSLVPNGQWEWAIKNHLSSFTNQIIFYQIGGILISLISGIFVYYTMKERYRLSDDAMLDSLTGLPNRRLLNDRMEEAFYTAKRFQKLMAVMAIDIDYFKKINDTYGHDFGDEALKNVALTIKATLREGDTVSRVGGDEFIVVLKELHNIGNIVSIANKLKLAFNQPLVVLDKKITIHLSIGASIYRSETTVTLNQLNKEADIALYQSKANGRNTFTIFEVS
ncbi:MAG: diguanylate cyclase [Pseudomonadota bacterium]